MGAELAGLQRATFGLLALDPDRLDDEALHELVVGVQQERARLAVAAAPLLAAWDARRVWARDGSRSAAHRLARATKTAVVSARVEVRRARQLRRMPETRAAVLDGRLSMDHVDLLGRANRPKRAAAFAAHEATLVEGCARLDVHQGARLVRYWANGVDALAGDDGPDPTRPVGELSVASTLDGVRVLHGTLDPIGGEIVDRELHRLCQQLKVTDRRAGIDRTPAQRRAAALVEMARRSAVAPAGGRRPAPLFTVLLGDHTFRRLCELSSGHVLRPADLVGYVDDALLETVLFDGPTTVVSVSHRRTFRGAVRRAVEVRDRHCRHPAGCDVPADRCDVDHIVPYAEGGLTSQANARAGCSTHNRRPEFRDDEPTPAPERPVTRLDELRARLRWRHDHEPDRAEQDERAAAALGDLATLLGQFHPPALAS